MEELTAPNSQLPIANAPVEPPEVDRKPNVPTKELDEVEGDEGSASGRLSGRPRSSDSRR